MDRSVFLNGKILPESEAGISPFDLGLLRAHAVFDFMTAEGDRPFLFDEHYERIVKSAAFLNVEFPYGKKQFGAFVSELVERNGFERSIIRTIITGGVSPDGITPTGEPTVLVLIYRYDSLPATVSTQGVRAITLEFSRALPEVKTTHYLLAVNAQKQKHEADALEILYVKDGLVLEASTSNVFVVRNGTIATPKAGVLPGITRDLVVRLVDDMYPLEERGVTTDELFGADEVFITASGKDVVPIVQIDDATIADGTVGPITTRTVDLYKKYYNAYYER